jgi:hypothetical protein
MGRRQTTGGGGMNLAEPNLIRLTPMELLQGAMTGAIRRITSLTRAMDKNKHADKSDWATDIDGALAELAFAKWRRVYYRPSNMSLKEPDVGRVQVRSTSHRHGHLILRPNDKSNAAQVFVLAITDAPDVRLIGWKFGVDCMCDEYWRDLEAGWWVPQAALNDLELLPAFDATNIEAALA